MNIQQVFVSVSNRKNAISNKYLKHFQVDNNYTNDRATLASADCYEDCPSNCSEWQYHDKGWKLDTTIQIKCID